jgi:hypothetical protein
MNHETLEENKVRKIGQRYMCREKGFTWIFNNTNKELTRKS